MSARSRNPDTESFGIESSSILASSRLQTGVLPFLTTYFGPRTDISNDRLLDIAEGKVSFRYKGLSAHPLLRLPGQPVPRA